MDRDALVARCEARYRDTNNDIVAAATWVDHLEEAYADVAQASPMWPWTEDRSTSVSISANSNSTSLPTDVFSVFNVWNETDGFLLRPLHHRTHHIRRYDNDDESGIPETYRIYGGTIYVYPTPEVDTTLHIEYPLFTQLASGGTEPAFSEAFHHILIDGALSKAYFDDGNEEWQAKHQQLFDQGIFRMLNFYLTSRGQESYPIISDTFYDGTLEGT